MEFKLLLLYGFLFGIGFGFFVQKAGICFAHGLGEIYMGKGKRILRIFLVIFIISTLGFYLSKFIAPELGLKPIGQLRGYGFYNIISGMIFGAGILLNGGCILGTLRQMGEGNLLFLVVFLSFIPGMALIVYVIDPILKQGYQVQNILLPELLAVPQPYVVGSVVILALFWLVMLSRPKKK
ncbi:MAG: YeeE/YedE thiosulfate transporter family protein [Candidatus Auribacterota bacterium]